MLGMRTEDSDGTAIMLGKIHALWVGLNVHK